MQRPLFPALGATVLALLPPLSLHAARPATPLQEAAADAARLLPPDAVFVLRLESVDALMGMANKLAAASGEEPKASADLLEGMDLPGDPGLVDPARPLWFAVTIPREAPSPMLTYVLPVRDAAAYAGSLEDAGGWSGAVAGGYAGASQVTGYAALEAPSPLAATLRPGMLSMHVDFATLIGIYRPFIEMGMEQAEMQIDTLAQMSAGPVDIGPLLELYLDMAWDFIDSAETLDVSLARQGGSLELSGWLATLDESPMAAWGQGAAVDLRGWPAQVDPGATLSMALAGDWATLMKRMEPLLDASFAMYPAGTQEFFTEYLAACEPLYGLMGPTFAGGDLGGDGMRMTYVVRSADPVGLFEGMKALAQRFEGQTAPLGIAITPPEDVEIGGLRARRFRMDIDYEVLAASMGEELGQAEREQMRDAMAALYGADGLTFTMAPTAEALVMAFGGGEAFAERVLTTPAGKAPGAPADLERALAAAFGGADVGLEDLPTSPLPITLWTGIREGTWSGGVSLELEALASFIEAAADANDAAAEEAFEFDVFGEPEMDSRAAVVQAELALIEAALELFAINNGGRYPDSLELLVVPDENGESYLDELPGDPWGNPYHYEPPSAEGVWRLVCHGSDGVPGGEGEASDVVVSGHGH